MVVQKLTIILFVGLQLLSILVISFPNLFPYLQLKSMTEFSVVSIDPRIYLLLIHGLRVSVLCVLTGLPL